MDQVKFTEECYRLFDLNALPCTDRQANLLYHLTEQMLKINRTMNLTAITEEKAIILRHYVDSLTISEYIPQNSILLDVGCGAGFPTLPLAIFRPDVTITALDGTAKRIHYVQDTAEQLELSNVTAIAGRAEDYAHREEYRESFDMVTARAVANLAVLGELCLGFVKPGGQMIAMKAQQAENELKDASRCISLCGGEVSNIIQKTLSSSSTEQEHRTLIFISKSASTPKIYPRHFSKISKKTL
ncbi:MAG: 16S rRNA (guanine(527)-N(7))-methyltransferase RsmG [Clostridia bacterium]|nr:16S rRNA (guanine(527)-N(7))-methyltransferase RsmG [Clostridia bacterium]